MYLWSNKKKFFLLYEGPYERIEIKMDKIRDVYKRQLYNNYFPKYYRTRIVPLQLIIKSLIPLVSQADNTYPLVSLTISNGISHSSIGFNCFAVFSNRRICFSIFFLLRSSLALTTAGSIRFFFFSGSPLWNKNYSCLLYTSRCV